MTFFNPMVLFGLLAASVPLILHLLNLRKLKKIEFSSLKFLKELQKTRIRRLKIKRLLLLILRTLAIICLVLAFARPTINSNLPLLGNYSNTSSVILFDNSLSMDVSDEYGKRFNQAKNTANSILNLFKEGDEVCLLNMTDISNEKEYLLSRNSEYVKNELNNIKISNSTADLESGLKIAEKILENSIYLSREVFVISDAQKNIFQNINDTSQGNLKNIANLFFFPIGNESKNKIQNVSIDSLNLISQIFSKDKAVEIEYFLNNNSDNKIEALSSFASFNNQRVAQRSSDLLPEEKKTLFISAPAQASGLNSGYIETEGDAFDGDNRRYFGFLIPEKPKAALIGDKAKTRFLYKALSVKMNGENLVDLDVFDAGEISRIDMNKYDIMIPASGPLRETDFQRLEQYARSGGRIMLFADGDTQRDIFNLGLSMLGLGGISERIYSEEMPGNFTKVDKIHPLFQGVFKGTTDSKEIVESPKIFKAYSSMAGQQIIEIPGGSFLTESRIGEGKVLYYAVPADAAWSNYPFTGLFPTLAYKSVIYLAAKEQAAKSVEVGGSINITVPKKYASNSNFKVIDPKNTEYFLQAAQMPAGTILTLNNLYEPGCYKIYTPENEPVAIAAVNINKSESDFKALAESDIETYIEKITGKNTNIRFLDNTAKIKDEVFRARVGTELWHLFAIIALLCLLAEMFVAKNSKNEMIED